MSVSTGKIGGHREEADEEPKIPTFVEAVSSFEIFRKYFCSHKIYDASLSRREEGQSCPSFWVYVHGSLVVFTHYSYSVQKMFH